MTTTRTTYPELDLDATGTVIYAHDMYLPDEGPDRTAGASEARRRWVMASTSDIAAYRAAQVEVWAYRGAQAELEERYRRELASAYHETARHLGYTSHRSADDGVIIVLDEVLSAEQHAELRDRAHARVTIEHEGQDPLLGWRAVYGPVSR